MDTILEEQRALHEERERLTDAIVEEALIKKPTRRERINSDHRVLEYQERYRSATIQLKRIYTDKTKQRQRAVDYMIGIQHRAQPFEAFYDKYRALGEKHNQLGRKQNQVSKSKTPVVVGGGPDQHVASGGGPSMSEISASLGTLSHEFKMLDKQRDVLNTGNDDQTPQHIYEYRKTLEETSTVNFSYEEDYGKYLNLHAHHLEFLNIKGIQKGINYFQYVRVFDNLSEIPKKIKKHNSYRVYLENLKAYLIDYLSRVNPLYDQKLGFTKLKVDFDDEWRHGTFRDWKASGSGGALKKGAALSLDDVESVDDLKQLSLDRLKSALQAIGLKCGGTLEQRAERLFSVKGLSPEQIPNKLKVKNSGNTTATSQPSVSGDKKDEEVAWLEAQVYKLAELLDDYKNDTVENIQRKAARSGTELAEEDEDESDEEIEKVDDTVVGYNPNEEEIIYNPKNLPLDWDGKPIPYWLYKLHGLNISYPCEICGGFKYRGLKPFQKHFAEWRHAHGMRCLNIPNTAHFVGVTQIKEAQQLWAKLKAEKIAERFNPDTEEEFEDNLGNVLNKKTFDDLRRQGLC